MLRLKTWTGRSLLTSSCSFESWLPSTRLRSSLRHSCGIVLISSNSYRLANSMESGDESSPRTDIAAPCTPAQSSSERKLSRVRTVGRIISEETISPFSSRRKISEASANTCPRKAGHAASSTTSRGTMPYGRAMNSNRPAENPMCNLRDSSGSSPCRARNDPTLSA